MSSSACTFSDLDSPFFLLLLLAAGLASLAVVSSVLPSSSNAQAARFSCNDLPIVRSELVPTVAVVFFGVVSVSASLTQNGSMLQAAQSHFWVFPGRGISTPAFWRQFRWNPLLQSQQVCGSLIANRKQTQGMCEESKVLFIPLAKMGKGCKS